MDLGQLHKPAHKINVNLVDPYGRITMVGSPVQQIYLLGAQPILTPKLLPAGENFSGYAAWLLAKAIIVQGQKFQLVEGYGILAKYNYTGISPLVQTTPKGLFKSISTDVWPIIKRITKNGS